MVQKKNKSQKTAIKKRRKQAQDMVEKEQKINASDASYKQYFSYQAFFTT